MSSSMSLYAIDDKNKKLVDSKHNRKYDLRDDYRLKEPLPDEVRKDLISDTYCFAHLYVYGSDVQTKCPEYNRNLCFGDNNTEFAVLYDKDEKCYYLSVKDHTWFGCEEYTTFYKYELPFFDGYWDGLYFNIYEEYGCVNIYNRGFFVLSLGAYKDVMKHIEDNTEINPIHEYSMIQGGLKG